MARKKRKRRLGHITDSEREKVARSLIQTQDFCFETFTKSDGRLNACLSAVSKVTNVLRRAGFKEA